MIFYRNLLAAAFDMAPDATMEAVRDEVVGFEMPGANMPATPATLSPSPRRVSTTCACTTTRSSSRC